MCRNNVPNKRPSPPVPLDDSATATRKAGRSLSSTLPTGVISGQPSGRWASDIKSVPFSTRTQAAGERMHAAKAVRVSFFLIFMFDTRHGTSRTGLYLS